MLERDFAGEIDGLKNELSKLQLLLEKHCSCDEKNEKQKNEKRNKLSSEEIGFLLKNGSFDKILSCIGNSDRLFILLTLLRKSMSVAELVEECGFNSTGQAYHHMKLLIAADLIEEDKAKPVKGIYTICENKKNGIIMILAGLTNMIEQFGIQEERI